MYNVCVCVYVCVCVCVHVYLCVSVCVCVYVCHSVGLWTPSQDCRHLLEQLSSQHHYNYNMRPVTTYIIRWGDEGEVLRVWCGNATVRVWSYEASSSGLNLWYFLRLRIQENANVVMGSHSTHTSPPFLFPPPSLPLPPSLPPSLQSSLQSSISPSNSASLRSDLQILWNQCPVGRLHHTYVMWCVEMDIVLGFVQRVDGHRW